MAELRLNPKPLFSCVCSRPSMAIFLLQWLQWGLGSQPALRSSCKLWAPGKKNPYTLGCASLVGSDGKESACNAGDPASIPDSGRPPWRREWQPTPVFLLGKSYGQRSLMGYSPWSHKELGTTEQLSTWTLWKTDLCSLWGDVLICSIWWDAVK